MNISKKIGQLKARQIQEILKNLDYDELAILMAYHLDDNAREILAANMSDSALIKLNGQVDRAKKILNRFEAMVDKQLSE